jgi:hypothetical protein
LTELDSLLGSCSFLELDNFAMASRRQIESSSEFLMQTAVSSQGELGEPDSLPGDVGPSSMYAQKVAARSYSDASLRSRSLERMLRRQPCRQIVNLRVSTALSNEILCSIDIPGTLSGV